MRTAYTMRSSEAARVASYRSVSRVRNLRTAGQAGDMLIEVLIAVAVMATVVVTGIMALGLGIKASATHQSIVRSSAEAAIAAEHIEQLDYVPCDAATPPTAAQYQAALATLSNPYLAQPHLTLQLLDLEFLQDAEASPPVFGACPGVDQGVQRVVARVTTTDGAGHPISGRVPFLKRDARCIGVTTTVAGQTC